MPPTNRSVVCLSVRLSQFQFNSNVGQGRYNCPVGLDRCPSVTLVHPAKAVGWNEMSFDRDTDVVHGNTGA